MTQFLDHKDNGDFLIYYTRPSKSGTPEFEHKVYVNLADVKKGKKPDGSDDDDTLIVECPCGCGMYASVPLAGGEEAQRLHARYHAHTTGKPYISQAVQDTMDRVKAKGGEPRLDPKKG